MLLTIWSGLFLFNMLLRRTKDITELKIVFFQFSLCSYEFVKYLRHYVESSLGTVVENETKKLIRGDGQHAVGSSQDILIHAITNRTRDSAEWVEFIIVVVENILCRCVVYRILVCFISKTYSDGLCKTYNIFCWNTKVSMKTHQTKRTGALSRIGTSRWCRPWKKAWSQWWSL